MRSFLLIALALAACNSVSPCIEEGTCVGEEADTDTDTDTDIDTDTDTDTDTDIDDGQDAMRFLTINVNTPDGDPVAGMSFNYCLKENEDEPERCTAWNEFGQVVFDTNYVQWSTDEVDGWLDGVVRFNVSYYPESEIERDDDGMAIGLETNDEGEVTAQANNWLCYGASSLELTGDIDVWVDDIRYDDSYVGTVAMEGGCSAYLLFENGQIVAY